MAHAGVPGCGARSAPVKRKRPAPDTPRSRVLQHSRLRARPHGAALGCHLCRRPLIIQSDSAGEDFNPLSPPPSRRFSPTRFICRKEVLLVSISLASRQINAIR